MVCLYPICFDLIDLFHRYDTIQQSTSKYMQYTNDIIIITGITSYLLVEKLLYLVEKID